MASCARLALLAVLLAGVTPLSSALAQAAAPRVGDKVQGTLDASGQARVLITLRSVAPSTAGDPARAAATAAAQDAVVAQLPAREFTLARRYRNVPGLAGIITPRALDILRAHPMVISIDLDETGRAHLPVSVPALRANVGHGTLSVTGQGVTAAVLDTGIDMSDTELTVVSQQCFATAACPPKNTDTGPSAQDNDGHGTNVAAILASNGSVFAPGFAPAAKLVAVKVLDSRGSGYVSDWIAGLDYVSTNLASLGVRVVNMSLGTDTLYAATCDAHQPLFAAAVAQLAAAGVVVFASAGNHGSPTHIAAPACLTGVVAVGATYKGSVGRQPSSGTYQDAFGGEFATCFDATTSFGTVTCFTNSNARLDVVAPGAPILAWGLGADFWTYWGTSQASPTAAGVAAMMLQVNPAQTPAQIASRLKASGATVTDPKNGLQFPQIDALNAVQLALPLTATAGASQPTLAVGQTLTVAAGVTNPGLPEAADFYVGLVRPDSSVQFFLDTGGTANGSLSSLASFQPLARAVPLAAPFAVSRPTFYSAQRSASDLPGAYVFFVLVVRAGALAGATLPPGTLLGLATTSFAFP